MSASSILLVGCDDHLSRIYARRLERDGWTVDVSPNLHSGEQKASRMRPNVLFLDDSCAVDILEEIKRLRRLPTLLKTKIVLLSRHGDFAHIQEALLVGVDMYLVEKHFSPSELVNKMKTLID